MKKIEYKTPTMQVVKTNLKYNYLQQQSYGGEIGGGGLSPDED